VVAALQRQHDRFVASPQWAQIRHHHEEQQQRLQQLCDQRGSSEASCVAGDAGDAGQGGPAASAGPAG
jgi:hypothetical protein